MTHNLKIRADHFQQIKDGKKRFVIRLNDREYKQGDILRLREIILDEDESICLRETGRILTVRVTGASNERWALHSDLVIMSIKLSQEYDIVWKY